MAIRHRAQTHEHEDDGLHDARGHLEYVLDGGARLLGYVVLDILLHEHAAEGDGQNARRRGRLGRQIGNVRVGHDNERLEHGRSLREFGRERTYHAEHEADEDAAARHHQERGGAQTHVHCLEAFASDVDEAVEETIQNL